MIATLERPTESVIRETEVRELHDIARLGYEFYEEASLPGGFNPDVFVTAWTGFLESDIGVLFVWRIGGEPAGAIGGLRYPDPNNGDMVAMELFWFVTKPHRGGLAAARLLKRFEAWASDSGCKRVSMINLENESSRGLPAFYSRMGYKPMETHYVKEL